MKRAIKTLYNIQQELDLHWIPVQRHWRLNERMYGALQGKNKSETAAKYGEDQVKVTENFNRISKEIDLIIRSGVVLTIFHHRNSKNQVNTIHELILNTK